MNQITKIDAPQLPEVSAFELQQRQAKMFALSPLVPQHLRNGGPETAIANCYIALKLAEIMGEAPLIVMQNIHVVSGKAGFAAQYMIARANRSGIFDGRIDWRVDESDKSNLSVTAYATLKDTGEEIAFTCDMKMAHAEGWTKNPKYKSMPELMLRYRSATFLVRLYAPDVMLGYQAAEEIEDVGYITEAAPVAATRLTPAMLENAAADAETGEIVEAEPEAETAEWEPEGRADDEHGDQHGGDEWDSTLDALRDALAAKDNVIDLNSYWKSEGTQQLLAGMPAGTMAVAKGYFDARRTELKGAK